MIRSGLNYPFGIGFWGPNGHDGIWHLSLINQLQKNIPPQNPVYSGTILNNYHWGFNLFAAFLGKIIGNNVFTYFQILPLIISLAIGFFSYQIGLKNFKNKITSVIFVFLTFFTSSFGWIYILIKHGQIGGESLFWSMQSVSMLINPPFSLSLVIILIGLIIWFKNYQQPKYIIAIFNGIIFGLLSGIKVYSGILIGLTLVIFWLINFIKNKKFFNYTFIVWLTTLIISIGILSLLGVLKNSSFLEFKPLWFTHSMIESIDKLYFPKLAAYRINLSENLSLIKLPIFISIEVFLIVIFLIGNMGFRFLGFFQIFSKIKTKTLTDLEKFILILMIISFLLPMVFVQKGTAWNTIQFFYYFLFFSNIFFAQFLTSFIKEKKVFQKFVFIVILVLSNIGSLATIKDCLGNPPPAAIPPNEIKALDFLKNQKDGIVLSYPYDKYLKNNFSTPIPIYAYETTSYISAFSHQITFLEDEMNLDITGFDWKSRRNLVEKFFNSTDKYFTRGVLIDNHISYIYLVGDQKLPLSPDDLQINSIFDQSGVKIYQVQR